MKKGMKAKTNGIFGGVLIIAIAVCLILNAFHVFYVGVGSIILGGIMLAIFVSSFISINFTGMLFAAAHIFHIVVRQFDLNYLPSGWSIILGGTLLGVGLDILLKGFKKKRKSHHFEFAFSDDDDNEVDQEIVYDSEAHESFTGSNGIEGSEENKMSGKKISIENSFGKSTKYITSDNFKYGSIENGFGDLTVYFDNVTLHNDEAQIDIDNGFGNINIYVPKEWRLELKVDSGFGHVKVEGTPSKEEDAPTLYVKADNGFGHVTIYSN